MDTIIGLLFVLVPVIFVLIGQGLKKAGKDGEGAPSMPEVFPSVSRHMTDDEEGEQRPHRKQQPQQPSPQPVAASAYKAHGDERPRKKGKLDPKKLVIYSEIMKPKF